MQSYFLQKDLFHPRSSLKDDVSMINNNNYIIILLYKNRVKTRINKHMENSNFSILIMEIF